MDNIGLLKSYTENNYLPLEKIRIAKLYKNLKEFKNIDINEFWKELSDFRKSIGKKLIFLDKEERNLFFNYTKESREYVNFIEDLGRDKIEDIIPDDIKESALIDSLIDEAFSSSVIEGAYSTRKRAHDMIINNKQPKNKSEKMILNNFRALEYTMDNIEEELTHDIVYSIWEILTNETIEEEDICSGYRTGDVEVRNKKDELVFEGPSSNEIQEMMESLIEYFNGIDNTNPIVKACIIHYYFVYIHPFFDGNGRTARALMHMYLIRNGYDFLKYFSISKILVDNRSGYYESIRTCEIHESDVTYFIDFYTKLLIDTISEIRKNYLNQFSKKIIFESIEMKNVILNARQEKVLNYFLKRTKSNIDIKEYTKKYQVTTETARKDLQILVDFGFFKKIKSGKKYLYNFNDIKEIISRLDKL
ncbi:MAG: Fic family protein [Acetoanaerobium sp.]|nr:Fic family protein [Acetoanaerobium sp.]